jgi:hypothetical protein
MKRARTSFLMLAVVGFLFSLIMHLLALSGRAPSSESWYVVPFLGALVAFVSAAYLSGAKAGWRGMPIGEIVKNCPTWLRRTEYFFSAYLGLSFLWVALKTPGIFHWRKVELPTMTGFVIVSALSMSFYVGAFSMLFGKLFGGNRTETTSSNARQETT